MKSSIRPRATTLPVLHHPAELRTWRGERRGISIVAILVSLLIVVLGTLAAASTFVALRATKAREQAEADFARASAAIDEMVMAAASSEDLQSFKMAKTRRELLKPAVAYYEAYEQAYVNDEVPPLTLPSDQFHLAGLQALQGSNKSVPALAAAMRSIDKLRAAKVDPDTYPSLQDCAMSIAPPQAWIMLKGASMQEMKDHPLQLFFGLNGAIAQYMQVNREFPEAIGPREELASLLTYSGALQAQGGRRTEGLAQMDQAREHLESLMASQPGNPEYQTRMADLCMLVGAAQKAQKDLDAATASYDKAIQLREALSAANPDDKDLAAQLEAAKKELEKLKSAAPAKVAAAPEAEEPATEEAPADISGTVGKVGGGTAADPAAEDASADAAGEQPSEPVATP